MKVFRLIEYEGSEEWIERTLANSINGKLDVGLGTITVHQFTHTATPVVRTPEGQELATKHYERKKEDKQNG